MSTLPDRADPPDKKVPCEKCQKEIPLSEAFTSETEDYVLYFCGAERFEQWRKNAEREYDNPNSR